MKKKVNTRNYSIPLTIVITIILTLIPLAMAYGGLTEKVNNLKDENLEKTETIISMSERIIVLEKIAAGTEVSLNAIESDVKEIKTDIRDIANAVRSP